MDKTALLALLRKHKNNLAQLELQRANFGISVPLDVINSLEYEKTEIERLESELASLEQITEARTENNEGDDMPLTDNQVESIERRFDKLRDDLHALDTRQQIMITELSQVNKRLEIIESRITGMSNDPFLVIPRSWLIIGALAMVTVLVLLIIVNWRMF